MFDDARHGNTDGSFHETHCKHPNSPSNARFIAHQHFIVPSLLPIQLVFLAEQPKTIIPPIRVSSPLTRLMLRYTARHDHTMRTTDKSRPLSGSKDDFYRAPRTNDRGLDEFLLDRPPSSGAMDDVGGFCLLYSRIAACRLNRLVVGDPLLS